MKLRIILLLAFSCILLYCKTNKQPQQASTSTSNPSGTVAPVTIEKSPEVKKPDFSESPVLSPRESMAKMRLQPGFNIELVAAEPLVGTPVTLSFDKKGRMWVVEMVGYMPDTVGTGEDVPNGKIVILEDKDKDGVAETRTVFLDSLVLPRAICLIENGILVAETPNLWFYEIVNDKPVKRTLVDPEYAVGGNVEHQPNGLLRALDNWIYNAKSTKRYRKDGNKWLIETTHFRGQWGISQDNQGRLYYNNNSANVIGDFFLPGFGAGNANIRDVAGFNERIVKSNRVYPIRPTPGVNRGYMKGVLDDSLRLVNFTAACGPMVYRGGLFEENNVFVPEPSANLIKRNIFSEAGNFTGGRQFYDKKEFLASTDERFRPVSLNNSPDGAIYVTDMYRGIIQHKTYLTTYLKGEIGKRELTQPLNCGRIYKITPEGYQPKSINLPDDPTQLVALLGDKNGWIRDYAQHTLVDQKAISAVPALKQLLKESTNELARIHALWTLEGLKQLKTANVLALLQSSSWNIRRQAFGVSASVMTISSYKQYTAAFDQLIAQNDTLAIPYVTFLMSTVGKFDKAKATSTLQKISKKYPDNRIIVDAIVSNLHDRETIFQKTIASALPDTSLLIRKRLKSAIDYVNNTKNSPDPAVLAKQFPKGVALYQSICQTCHGIDGNGVKSLAPPLNQSEWVTGDKTKLISIVLFGLTGPVIVNKHLYQSPEINGDMPGIGYDPDMPNEDISQLLSFIRRSWKNRADVVEKEEVDTVRKQLSKRQKAFTADELR